MKSVPGTKIGQKKRSLALPALLKIDIILNPIELSF